MDRVFGYEWSRKLSLSLFASVLLFHSTKLFQTVRWMWPRILGFGSYGQHNNNNDAKPLLCILHTLPANHIINGQVHHKLFQYGSTVNCVCVCVCWSLKANTQTDNNNEKRIFWDRTVAYSALLSPTCDENTVFQFAMPTLQRLLPFPSYPHNWSQINVRCWFNVDGSPSSIYYKIYYKRKMWSKPLTTNYQ